MSDKLKISKDLVSVPGGAIVGQDLEAREGYVRVPATVSLGAWSLGQPEPLAIMGYLVATTGQEPPVFFAEVWFVGDRLGRALYGAFRVEVPEGTWSAAWQDDLKRLLHERLFHKRG